MGELQWGTGGGNRRRPAASGAWDGGSNGGRGLGFGEHGAPAGASSAHGRGSHGSAHAREGEGEAWAT